nr:hypothetical protein [Tanacetum cinerariifolium]
MSTRSSARNLFPPLDNPELTIRRRSRSDPTLLNNSEMAAEGNGDLPVPDLQTMKELCQPYLNGRGGPIAPIDIQETNFGLKNDMIQQVNRQVKAVTPNCETCGGPHSFNDCPATVGNTQNVYAAGAYQGNHHPQGNNQGRNQFFQGANQGQNQPPDYQAPAYQAPVYQAPVHQPQIPQPQVVTTNKFTNFIKFMKMNSASSSGSGTLTGNIITNPKEDLKGITTRCGTAYPGLRIPTNSSSLVVETLADLGASINLMPLSVWNKHYLLDFSPKCMTLELVGRSISHLVGVVEDVFSKVVELTLRVGKEAITFNLDQTSRYSPNYNDTTANRIDVIDMACEEYLQE